MKRSDAERMLREAQEARRAAEAIAAEIAQYRARVVYWS